MWAIRVCTVLVSMLLIGGAITGVGAPVANAACATTSTTTPGARSCTPAPKRLVTVCVERAKNKRWTRYGYIRPCIRTAQRWV